ncbi:unnamed protein product, partial [Polarella glacialis]
VPGGFEEATLTCAGSERVFLRSRAGFVKYALRHGYDLVPCYAVGEADMFRNPQGLWKFRFWLNELSIPAVAPLGFPFFPLLPRRVPVSVVIGNPVKLPRIANPTDADVKEHHARYVEALQKLYKEATKGSVSEGRPLEIWLRRRKSCGYHLQAIAAFPKASSKTLKKMAEKKHPTQAVIFQCLASALLGLGVVAKGSASGRLSCTTWLNGYLPVDASGDFIYQAVDVCSLLLVIWLLHQVLVTQKHTYNAEADSWPVLPVAIGCFLLAAILHADMNSRSFFDTLWMTGLFLSVVSVLPQLWVINKTGGVIQACTGHYIAMLAISRLLSGICWWDARFDVTSAPWIEGVNHAIWAILAAHALHLLLLGDFGYYYVKAVVQQGLSFQIELPAGYDMV